MLCARRGILEWSKSPENRELRAQEASKTIVSDIKLARRQAVLSTSPKGTALPQASRQDTTLTFVVGHSSCVVGTSVPLIGHLETASGASSRFGRRTIASIFRRYFLSICPLYS